MTVLESAGYGHRGGAAATSLPLSGGAPDLRIDLLFTDVVMPGRLDGIDLARAARLLRPGASAVHPGFPNLVREHADEDSANIAAQALSRRRFVRGASWDAHGRLSTVRSRVVTIEDG